MSSLWCDHCEFDLVLGNRHVCRVDRMDTGLKVWLVFVKTNILEHGLRLGVPVSLAPTPEDAREICI